MMYLVPLQNLDTLRGGSENSTLGFKGKLEPEGSISGDVKQ